MPLTVYTCIRHTLIYVRMYVRVCTSHSYYDTYIRTCHIRKRASDEPKTAQALPGHSCHSCSPTLNTGYLSIYITQVQTKIIQGHHSHHTYLPNLQMYIHKHTVLCICTAHSVCCPIIWQHFHVTECGWVGVGADGWGLVWMGGVWCGCGRLV